MTTLAKERPILFSGPMVQAILEGRKTQTRRVVKLSDPTQTYAQFDDDGWPMSEDIYGDWHRDDCPYGVVGDRLWVRETWKYDDWTEEGEPYIRYAADNATQLMTPSDDWADRVMSIWAELSAPENYNIDQRARDRKWRPSIFLPRWASRITLEVVSVRVERVQDISEEDAIAEGVETAMPATAGAVLPSNDMLRTNGYGVVMQSAKAEYAKLWDTINAKRGYGWDANPWVWVIEFKQVAS